MLIFQQGLKSYLNLLLIVAQYFAVSTLLVSLSCIVTVLVIHVYWNGNLSAPLPVPLYLQTYVLYYLGFLLLRSKLEAILKVDPLR